MLYSWIREYVKKYSFIKNTVFKNAMFYLYYEKNGKEKFKRLPYRATKNQLQRCIESIKKDTGFHEDRQRRIKEGQYNTKNDNEPVVRILW